MATRMQQRRGTATQWSTYNPILNTGELGFETDTGDFKIGDGTNHWNDLPYFKNMANLGGSLDDYIPLTEKGQALGVAELDANSKLKIEQLPDIAQVTVHAVADEPARLALSVQPGDIAIQANNGATYVLRVTPANIDSNWTMITVSDPFPTHDTDDLEEGVDNLYFTDERAQDAVGGVVGTGLSYDDNSGVISVTPNTYDAFGAAAAAQSAVEGQLTNHNNATTNVHGIADTDALATKLYADNSSYAAAAGVVGSAPSVLNTLQELATALGNDADFATTITNALATKQPIVNGVTDIEISYLDGVTSSIQAQIDSKASTTDLTTHALDTTNIHGISDTANLVYQVDLTAHNDDTTNVHGIANTADLATQAFVGTSIMDHNLDTTNVHGIANTADLATKSYADSAASTAADAADLAARAYSDNELSLHNLDTTNVHGIADTALLETQAGAQSKANQAEINAEAYADSLAVNYDAAGSASAAQTAAQSYADGAVSTHSADTTSVHGIADTAALATKTYADSAVSTHDSDTSAHGVTGNIVGTTDTQTLSGKTISYTNNTLTVQVANVSDLTATAAELNVLDGITASTAELNYVDGVTSSIQTQLDSKAPTASPTFTGTVSGITKSMVGLGNVDNTSDASKPVSTATQTALDLKANLASPTFTGTVNAATLILSGDLTVGGTTTTVNATDLVVSDPLIYIGEGNSANLVDLGLVSSFDDGTYQHAGLVRDASDGKWKLFKGVTDEPTTTVNFAQGSLDALAVGALEATSLTVGDVSNTEIGYLNGVTSAIQTQIDTKAPSASPTFTGTVVLPSTTSIGSVTDTEIGYLDGVTSAIQTQLDAKSTESKTETLTNKTISGSSNTITNIGNSSLTNSSVVINGVTVDLGETETITAATTNALTIGTGLSGTSFDGSSAVTIAIDSTVATLTGTQTLSGKTIDLASNTVTGTIAQFNTAVSDADLATLAGTETLSNKTLSSPLVDYGKLKSVQEIVTRSATASTGTINFDYKTSSVLYYTSNATANFTLNFRGDGSTTFNSMVGTDTAVTLVFMNTNGSSAYYPTTFQIDGTAVTPKWSNGTAPTSGNANSIDVYTFTIFKTSSTPTYTVIASVGKYA